MIDFGPFAPVVAVALFLAAAALAIRLAWAKRSGWQPPVEAVPESTARVASLGAMVALALIWVLRAEMGVGGLAWLAGGAFAVAAAALLASVFVSASRVFQVAALESGTRRVVGGLWLTQEARRVAQQHGQSEQEMLNDLHGRTDKVWPPGARALAEALMVAAYVLLILAGTVALEAAATLVLVAGGDPGVSPATVP